MLARLLLRVRPQAVVRCLGVDLGRAGGRPVRALRRGARPGRGALARTRGRRHVITQIADAVQATSV